jgi:hypothetical protein
MRRLAQAGERLGHAQEDVLRGKAREEFDRATTEQRALVETIGGLAGELLAEAGRPATDAVLERVAATLHAASLDADARAALVDGALQDEISPGGFEQLAGLAQAGRPPAAARPAGSQAERRERLDEARQALKEARAAERELRSAARTADTAVAKLRQALADAEGAAAAARERAEEAFEATARAAARVEELSRPGR